MKPTAADIVLSHYEACRSMGARAARKGTPYSDNPFEEGRRAHLEWSKGHNEERAMLANGRERRMSNPFDDIFSIPVKRPARRPRRYLATFPCGSTWEFDRDDLEVPDFADGEQNGMTYCFETVGEAKATLQSRGCKVETIKP